MSERRVAKRRHLFYYLRVWDVEGGNIIGHIADINTGGFMVVSDEPIEVGRRFLLEIQWREETGEEQRVRFQAESRWQNRDVNPAFYDIGFQLVDQPASVLLPIKDLIDELGFND